MRKNQRELLTKTLFIAFIALLQVSSVTGNALDEVVNELSAVARLLNAIAIQNDFIEHPEHTKPVIAEFLKVPQSHLLDELKAANVNGLLKELTAFHGAVKGISSLKTFNVAQLGTGMDLLERMKNASVLNLKASNSAESRIRQSTSSSQVADMKLRINDAEVTSVIQLLENVKRQTVTEVGYHGFRATLVNLQNPINALKYQWDYLKDFKNFLSDVLKLIDLETVMKETYEFAAFSKEYKDNLPGLQDLKTGVTNVKSDLSVLAKLQTGHHDLNKMKTSIAKFQKLLKEMLERKGTYFSRELTIGLPGSSADIAQMFKDFEKSQVLKMLSEGNNWKVVGEKMKEFEAFHKVLEKIETSWRSIAEDTALMAAFNQTLLRITEASVNMDELANVQTATSSMDLIHQCISSLARPAPFSFTEFEKLKNFSAELSGRVKEFDAQMAALVANSSVDTAVSQLVTWRKNFERMTLNSDSHAVGQAHDIIKNSAELDKTIRTLKAFKKQMLKFDNDDVLGAVQEYRPWDLVTKVFSSLDNSNLHQSLQCLRNGQSYNANTIIGLLNLRKSIDNVKGKVKTLDKVMDGLELLSKVVKQVDAAQKVTRRRSRRAARKLKGAFDLKDYDVLSKDVGSGIKSLRSISAILKAENDINALLAVSPQVHTAAEQLHRVWNTYNRDQLAALIPELKKVDAFAAQQKEASLEKMWTIFAEAEKIKSPEIDGEILEDPIAIGLDKNPDLNVKAYARDFKRVSPLDLQFQSHHEVRLKSASVALGKIRNYFDTVFGIKRNSSGMVIANGINPVQLALFVGGGIAVLLLAVGGFFGVKHVRKGIQEKKNWANRERLWIYYGYINDTYNICLAAKNDMQKEVKQMIKEGVQLDRYWRGSTALHNAVRYQNPGMVELLIRAGADRKLLNDYGQTAEDMCRHGLFFNEEGNEDDEEKDAQKITEMTKIFDKYKDKKFQHYAPKQLPWADFRCSFMFCEPKLAEEFATKYKAQVPPPNSDLLCTHSVVELDEEGAFNIDPFRGDGEDPDDVYALHTIFSPMVLVTAEWARLVLQDPKNFTKDYDHRVTKVRYDGKVYETVEEWKKWIRGRSISCCHRMYCFFSSGNDTYDLKFNSISYYLFSDYYNTPKETIEEAQKLTKPPPFWHPHRKRVLLIQPSAGDRQTLLQKEFTPGTLEQCDIMRCSEFFTWLLKMDGINGVENAAVGHLGQGVQAAPNAPAPSAPAPIVAPAPSAQAPSAPAPSAPAPSAQALVAPNAPAPVAPNAPAPDPKKSSKSNKSSKLASTKSSTALSKKAD